MRVTMVIAIGLCVNSGCSMNENDIEQKTRQWILVWNDGDPYALPLAEDFEHVSPFGRLEGRAHYLETVVPMAKKNAAKLTIEDVLVSGNRSAVHYQVANTSGESFQACDWLTFENGKLARVRSYYERPAALREKGY